jgi:hypothetical protein
VATTYDVRVSTDDNDVDFSKYFALLARRAGLLAGSDGIAAGGLGRPEDFFGSGNKRRRCPISSLEAARHFQFLMARLGWKLS